MKHCDQIIRGKNMKRGKRALRLMGCAAAVMLWATTSVVHAQDSELSASVSVQYKTLAPHDVNPGARHAKAAAVAAQTLPMWNYSITSPADGRPYTGSMAGGDPFFNGARTTNIPTYIVPLIIQMPDGGVFDPTATDSCAPTSAITQVQGSPVFSATNYTMNGINIGNTQYVDAFQRANFWEANVSVTGNSYHTMLSPIITLPAIPVQIPSGFGATNIVGCSYLGIVDMNTLDSIIQSTVLPRVEALGVSPSNFPLFVLRDVVMGNPGDTFDNCCVFGYHSEVASQVQTYAVADYDTSRAFSHVRNIAPISATVGNWMDNPQATNKAPAWGHLFAVTGCESALQAGDPLFDTPFNQSSTQSGVTMPNGITYTPVELTFFSWFYRQTPTLGAGGADSDNGSLVNPQVLCN